ncbi:hypothetical protein LCGC14_2177790, partial [marine sediment metagenome]
MKRLAVILAAATMLTGCRWFDRRRDTTGPDQQGRIARTAPASQPQSPPSAQPATSPAAATSEPARATNYRVIGPTQEIPAAVIQVNHAFITLDHVLDAIAGALRRAASANPTTEAFRRLAAELIR